jgi:hypothetical protein
MHATHFLFKRISRYCQTVHGVRLKTLFAAVDTVCEGAAQHLVLDLDQVLGIEEPMSAEQRIATTFWLSTRCERSSLKEMDRCFVGTRIPGSGLAIFRRVLRIGTLLLVIVDFHLVNKHSV